MPQRTRVLPSSFLWPFFTSNMVNTWKRSSSVSVPLNDISRGGTDRPMYTSGAFAHGTPGPLGFSAPPGSVSAHMRFDATPVVRLNDVDTRRFSNQANAG